MKSKLVVLQSEILRDLDKLKHLLEKFTASYKKYHRLKEYAYLVESAFYVNQIYTGFERMFENIAETFENSVDGKSWHKSLLDRMLLEIKGYRPAVISQSAHRCLNQLRAFRHFFRHTYDFDLEDDKFSIVAARVQELEKIYQGDIEKFLLYIEKLIKD